MTIRKDGGPNWGPSQPSQFRADMNGSKGPVPGMLVALTTGTDVDLSVLGTIGVARFSNYDETNFVRVGIREPATSKFRGFLKLKPLESWCVRLDDALLQEFTNSTGTGTSAEINQLCLKADTASCNVLVEVFED